MHKKSYAKINLFLRILGFQNNYHQLESALAFIDLYDEIEVLKSDKFSIEISGEFVKEIDKENNIFIQILNYFEEKFNISRNLKIKLQKNIPVSAGLGGGSSNGAKFMEILNEIYQLNLTKEKLQEISFNFGSDIAFFFEDKSSLIRGRGFIDCNLKEFLPIEILLINPKITLSTKQVFQEYQKNKPQENQEIDNEILLNKNIFELIEIENQLTNSAIANVNQISEILQELRNLNAIQVKMSGSGATCFAIFKKEEIDEAQEKFMKKFPDFFIKKTRILYCLNK